MCVIDENFDSASRLRRNLIAILDVAECSGRALIPSWQLTSKVVGEIAVHNVLMAAI